MLEEDAPTELEKKTEQEGKIFLGNLLFLFQGIQLRFRRLVKKVRKGDVEGFTGLG